MNHLIPCINIWQSLFTSTYHLIFTMLVYCMFWWRFNLLLCQQVHTPRPYVNNQWWQNKVSTSQIYFHFDCSCEYANKNKVPELGASISVCGIRTYIRWRNHSTNEPRDISGINDTDQWADSWACDDGNAPASSCVAWHNEHDGICFVQLKYNL